MKVLLLYVQAFIKLESLTDLPEEQRQVYEEVAMEIFRRLKTSAFLTLLYAIVHVLCVYTPLENIIAATILSRVSFCRHPPKNAVANQVVCPSCETVVNDW